MARHIAVEASNRPLTFLIALSFPALSLAMALGINNPSIYHLVLTRFVDNGTLDEGRLNSALGLLGMLALLMSALAQPLFGTLSDHTRTRIGRRYPFMLIGSIVLFAAMLFQVHSTSFWVLAGAALVTSAAVSAIQSPFNALIPDQLASDQMGFAAGIKTVLELIGVISAGMVVWLLLGDADRPELAILIVFVMLIGAVLFTIKLVPEQVHVAVPRQNQHSTAYSRYLRRYAQQSNRIWLSLDVARKRTRHVGRHRSFMWWLIHRMCLFGSFGILSKFTITYLVDVFGFTDETAREMQGQLIVILGLLVMATPIVAGIISDRIGRQRLVMFAGIMAGTSTLVVSQTRNFDLAVGMMAITGIGTAVFFSAGWAIVTGMVPVRQTAFYMGITNIATSIGSAIGLTGGFIVDFVNAQTHTSTQGYMVILVMAGLFYFASAIAIYQTSEQAVSRALRRSRLTVPQR